MVAKNEDTSDALEYLQTVKGRLQDTPKIYDEFMELIRDFSPRKVDHCGVISRVKELFKGQQELIVGFNTFLPKGFEITITEDEYQTPPRKNGLEECIDFPKKIRTRFVDDDRVYRSFVHMLDTYKQQKKSIAEVCEEVAILFRDHHDLLVDFSHFLPEIRIDHISVRSQVIILFESHEELIVGLDEFLKYSKAINFMTKVKARFQDDDRYKSFLATLKMYTLNEKNYEEVCVILRDHHDLREEFDQFRPQCTLEKGKVLLE
ncbi:unnamed protein product [Microthlaspi erraticum]|uniref:Histone deacetylase interacting domain-containing protein n=1 Tax=Microthlaspi erraticum TaxID=1685480 RepID=A0A6D2IVL3_9BRAS|nr:unnamed protein product [Microthlaspi erraticum]CAA7057662.1 unnamed protein product [Microthlaspi erraticum]